MPFNGDVRDGIIADRAVLAHFEEATVADIIEHYQAAEAKLEREARRRLPDYKRDRIEALLRQARTVLAAASAASNRTLNAALLQTRSETLSNILAVFSGSTPSGLDIEFHTLDAKALLRAYKPQSRRPFAKLPTEQVINIQKTIAQAQLEGMPSKDAARKLRSDLNHLSRNRADVIARTEIQEVSNRVHDEYMLANAPLLKGVQWVATLDGRSCLRCGILDGQQWPSIPDKPTAPLHPRCRCVRVPIAKQLDDIFPQLRGDSSPTVRKWRASMDGEVPDTETWAQWLPRMDRKTRVTVGGETMSGSDFVRGILGPGRYDLWKSGKVDIGNFSTHGSITPLKALRTVKRAKPWKAPKDLPRGKPVPRSFFPKDAKLPEPVRPRKRRAPRKRPRRPSEAHVASMGSQMPSETSKLTHEKYRWLLLRECMRTLDEHHE
jgi:SPP1 gp7 family putative phage head morphogenesis protein